jgi:acyl-coenzyme A thioesterase PaaI-like protein
MRGMPLLELPHTPNCLVCGRGNPHGLHLSLHVDLDSGVVTTRFTPTGDHIGFEGIVHGGVIATVLDEAMVWAATWGGRRFCVCGEMTVRFRESAGVGEEVVATARVDLARARLVTTSGEVSRVDGTVLATATGKYVPLPDERHRAFVGTLVDEAGTARAAGVLRGDANPG